MAIWVVEFSNGGTKLEIFLPKNSTYSKEILRIGLMGRCHKVPKFDFQSQFSMSKIIQIFLNLFFIEEYRGAHFLLLTFFDNINF